MLTSFLPFRLRACSVELWLVPWVLVLGSWAQPFEFWLSLPAWPEFASACAL